MRRPRRPVRRRDRAQRRWDAPINRLIRVLILGVAFYGILLIRAWLFPDGREPTWWWERALQQLSWCWVAALPAVSISLVSLVIPAGRRREDTGTPIQHLVCFRIVSRGRNADALADTVNAVRVAMAGRPLFPYCIEVVTDETVALPLGADLRAYVVPSNYSTPLKSLYKARALHYLSAESPLPDTAWVFHCDEESQVTTGLVGGIRDAVAEEEERAAQGLSPRIGQGTIMYYRNLAKHPFLTLADTLRTADDVTRFLTQFRIGRLFCGMHGSFILVRADIEKTVSFDVGPEGSITEDAWWAFEQSHNGREFRWVDGFLIEQSTEKTMDFVKQRRRWYCGLWKVCLYAPAPAPVRAALMVFMVTWVASALGGLYTVINGLTGYRTDTMTATLGALVAAWYVSAYLTGLWLNLRAMPAADRPARGRRCVLWVMQLLLLPVFGLLEAAGVVYAIVKPERGFHVVQKSGSSTSAAPPPGAPDPGAPDPGAPDPGAADPGAPDPGAADPGARDPGAPDPAAVPGQRSGAATTPSMPSK